MTLPLLRRAQLRTNNSSHRTSCLSCFHPHNSSHLSLIFNYERKQNFLPCLSNLSSYSLLSSIPLHVPVQGCWEGHFVVFHPGSSCFLHKFPSDSFHEIPLPTELLSPSDLPFPFFHHLWLCSVLWAVTSLEKMLFQALLFHLYLRTGSISMPPLLATILNGSHRFCPLPLTTRNILELKWRYPILWRA